MMTFKRLLLPLLALVASPLLVSAASEKSWTLYHAWKGHDFTKRGKVRLSLDDSRTPTLSVENAQQAQELPLDDFYQLKLVEDGTKNVYTITSVPACQVHRANFRDEITLTLNHRASVVSMAYVPLVSPLAPPCNEIGSTGEAREFSSKAAFETATPGMVLPAVLPQTKPPAGLKFIKSKNGKNSANPLEQQEEPMGGPQGFIRKYWYILLPLFIMSMTSGGAPSAEEERAPHPSQAAQGGGGGGQAAAGTTTSSAAAAPSGGGAQRRRGKRG